MEIIENMKVFTITIMKTLYKYEKCVCHVNCKRKETLKYMHICCDPGSAYMVKENTSTDMYKWHVLLHEVVFPIIGAEAMSS